MKKIFVISGLLLLLNGCGIYQKYERPDTITSNGLYGTDVTENSGSTTLATLSWQEIFTDSLLQNLIDTVLVRNADLQSMEYTVEQAKTSYRMSKLGYVPGFSFSPQGGYNINDIPGWSYSIPVVMDWEIDIFGRLTTQKRKAKAQLLMTEDMQQATRTQLIANTASLYYQLLALDAQLQLTDSTARTWREIIRVMQRLKEAGMMNEVSVTQSEATCYATEAEVLELQKKIRETENALCLLLKQPPHSIARGSMQEQVLPEQLSVGVSAQLLSNRPDVRQAERNLEVYYYGVANARAQFYPSLSISGSLLWNGSIMETLLGSLVQPIFQHGTNKGNLDIAKAQYEQALIAFEQQLVKAGSEVNDALRQCLTARQKKRLRGAQVEALQRAMDHTQQLMTHGSTTYLEVIYTQQSLLDAQISQITDWQEEAEGVIKLYQALGGGAQ